jgi:hypothetical protein
MAEMLAYSGKPWPAGEGKKPISISCARTRARKILVRAYPEYPEYYEYKRFSAGFGG